MRGNSDLSLSLGTKQGSVWLHFKPYDAIRGWNENPRSCGDPIIADSSRVYVVFAAGNTNTDFALASTTGVLTVAATFGLSKATTSSYTLVIHATDSGTPTLTGTTSLSITVSESSSAQSLMPMVAFIAIGTAIPFL